MNPMDKCFFEMAERQFSASWTGKGTVTVFLIFFLEFSSLRGGVRLYSPARAFLT